MKIHLFRSERSTWCGRKNLTNLREGHLTRNANLATCEVCIKANAAEQRKENAASFPTLTTLS